MSAGRPLIASNVGALDELVESDIGLQFEAGDPERMAEAIRRLWRDPGQADRFGRAARARYLERYTPEHNFEALMKIYDFAMGRPEHCSLGATA
jgi:glycosyltransferase involved in cell wall biosynthesis